MSQYINPSNQTILWNVLQKMQLFQMVIPKGSQEMWFKQIIGDFYNQNKQLNFHFQIISHILLVENFL
jgi:hypothetical protein